MVLHACFGSMRRGSIPTSSTNSIYGDRLCRTRKKSKHGLSKRFANMNGKVLAAFAALQIRHFMLSAYPKFLNAINAANENKYS